MSRTQRSKIKLMILFLAFIVTIIAFYFIHQPLAYLISTITATISIMVLILQLGRDYDLNAAKFILDFNINFTSDRRFTAIELELERFFKNQLDETTLTFEGEKRQDLINYLIHLECLSAIISRNVLTVEAINDLFYYRFFLAANNPVVQKIELVPDAEYYKGLYILYKEWASYRESKGMSIIMQETSLSMVEDYEKYAN